MHLCLCLLYLDLSVYLPICLSIHLSISLSIDLPIYVSQPMCLHTCAFELKPVDITHVFMHACMHAYIQLRTYTYTHIHTCTHAHMHTYTHTYIYIYIHTYIHTHVHTYIHNCIGAYVYVCMCIYIYRERERERASERARERERERKFWLEYCTFAWGPVPLPCIGGELGGLTWTVPPGEPTQFSQRCLSRISDAVLFKAPWVASAEFGTLLANRRPSDCKISTLTALRRGETDLFTKDTSEEYAKLCQNYLHAGRGRATPGRS